MNGCYAINSIQNSFARIIFLLRFINVLIVLSIDSFAQSQIAKNDIKGYIKDVKNGEALPYVNIVLKGQYQAAVINSDGYFVIVNAPAGICTLQITFIGYKKKEAVINNDPEKPKVITVEVIYQISARDR